MPLAVTLSLPNITFLTRREITRAMLVLSWGLLLPFSYKCTLRDELSISQGRTSSGSISSGPSRELRSVSQAGVSNLCLEEGRRGFLSLPMNIREKWNPAAGLENSLLGTVWAHPWHAVVMGHALGGGKPNRGWWREGQMDVKWVSKEFINPVKCGNVMNRQVGKMK